MHATRVTRFWMLVQRRRPDECWPFEGHIDKDGYGRFFDGQRMRPAHELALTFTTGEERPRKHDTCHSQQCTTRACCNPRHLRFDTRRGNVGDTVALGRQHRFGRKLTDREVGEIRTRLACGAIQKDLATQYGVNDSMISMIKTGKRH